MKISKDVKYIVKGFIIPKRGEDDKPIYTKVFNEEDRKLLYKQYKDFLEAFRDTYLQLHGIDKLKTAADINDFVNTFVFYIKSLLIIDPIPAEELHFLKDTVIPSPTTMLRGLMIAETKESMYKMVDRLIENGSIKNELIEIETMINERIFRQLHYLYEKASVMFSEPNILDFPADTRIGSNTSSLLIHMLTTSAIAVSIYLECNKDYDLKTIQTLRMVSLFHDVCKIENWYMHKALSSKFLNDLLYESAEDEAREIVSNAAQVIREQNLNSTQERLLNIFKSADILASRSDRIQQLILGLLNDEDKRIIENKRNAWKKQVYDEPFNKWEFWEQFSCEDIMRFTEEFCRNASSINARNPAFDIFDDKHEIVDPIISNEVAIVRLDFKGIQSFIHSSDIRVMNGASRYVDLMIFVLIPLYITKYMKLPAESILYYGGGNITLIIPKCKLSKNNKDDENEFDKLKHIFKNIEYGYSSFYSKLAAINYEIDNVLLKKKLTNNQTLEVHPNIHKRCQSCSKNEITKTEEKIHEKKKNMCDSCREKFEIGDAYHFSKRVDILINPKKDAKNNILNKILEYIAGHSDKEILGDNIDRYKDLAFVKFDGNILGQLMASSISLTDAHERSVRIDHSVKKAFRDFLLKLDNNCFREYVKRIIMGLMYMGGDDGALIMPADVTLPFTLHMINEYNMNMGRKSTLSVGIAVSKPKHPIQLLKEGAEYLLDDIAKKDKARTYAYKIHNTSRPEDEEFKGALAFYVADGGSISKDALNSIFSVVRDEEHLSIQPYFVTNYNDNRSINRLLDIIIQDGYIDGLLEYLKKEDKEKNLLKDIRNACMKSLQVNIDGENDLKLRVIYSQKGDELLKSIVRNLLVRDNTCYFGIYDLYQLLKVMGVEQQS